ncbi:hypothetical protein D6D20_00498 [Aureobasidium pullulans]|uniref:Uncharacterized protein n=1 Tax=Aureobasidium pullulans TaxID=5580 RepID=A0A4S8ZN46_AURPU|nr:hypothetical protein D6D20_00498 [Aureobasidium pullulans]
MELEQNAERKNRDIGRRDSLILSAHAAPVKVFPLIGLTDSNPQAAETCIQALLYYPQKVLNSGSNIRRATCWTAERQERGFRQMVKRIHGLCFLVPDEHRQRSLPPPLTRPVRTGLASGLPIGFHLHEEAVAVGSRRSMEQRDIFDLDPLAEWRVLRGHGAMFLYDSSEMVKACIRGRLVDPDNRLHIADFLHPDLGPLRLLGYSLDDYVAMLRILVLKEFFR